jgi:hypothetical protein
MFIKSIKKTTIVLILSFVTGNLFAQQWTAELDIPNEGLPLNFSINSFDKYNNGLSFTVVGRIFYIDTICNPLPCSFVPGSRWELLVRANSAFIEGDGGNTLPLSTIELEVTTDDPIAIYNSPLVLSDVDQTLISNGLSMLPGNFRTLTLTYNIGTNTSLLGESTDNYYVDIIFTLQKE